MTGSLHEQIEKLQADNAKLTRTLHTTREQLKGLATVTYLYFYEENAVTKATLRKIVDQRIHQHKDG